LRANQALDNVKEIYNKTTDAEIKNRSTYALYVFTKENKYFQELCQIVKNNKTWDDKYVAILLGDTGNTKAVKFLTEMLVKTVTAKGVSGDNVIFSNYLEIALEGLGEASVRSMIELLDSDISRVLTSALAVLRTQGDERAIKPILKLVTDEASRNSTEIKTINAITIRYGYDKLISVLRNEKEQGLRIAAAKALGLVGTVSVVRPMVESIKSNNKVVSGKIGDAISDIIYTKHHADVINHGDNYEKWVEWYNKNKKEYELK
jgi:HEAT repeat protein